jgi:hypothetical protein
MNLQMNLISSHRIPDLDDYMSIECWIEQGSNLSQRPGESLVQAPLG